MPISIDKSDIASRFTYRGIASPASGKTPMEAAKGFLNAKADVLKLPPLWMELLDQPPVSVPIEKEKGALRFRSEKKLMGSTIVNYAQTIFGLPIYQTG